MFNYFRKIANKFGIQILKMSTYNQLVRNLDLEAEKNSELSDALVNSIYKEQYHSQKTRMLLERVNSLKNSGNKLSKIEKAHLLDTSTLSSDALDAIEKERSIQQSFNGRDQVDKAEAFTRMFNANAKALEAIDFLETNYDIQYDLEKNIVSKKSKQTEAKKLFLFNLNSKKEKALQAINSLDKTYSKTLLDLKYYE